MIDVTRSMPAPKSLKSTRSYSGDDVKARLRADFLDKCYLCEGRLLGDFQVEHLRPRADFPARKQDWKNLFPAHGDTCNQRRLRWSGRGMVRNGRELAWPRDGLLDCAGGQDVERRLEQWFNTVTGDINVFFIAVSPTDGAAKSTAEELTWLHTGHTAQARKIRDLIQSQYIRVQECLTACLRAQLSQDAAAARQHAAEFRRLTSREAPYTALIRTTLQRRQQIPEGLRQELGF